MKNKIMKGVISIAPITINKIGFINDAVIGLTAVFKIIVPMRPNTKETMPRNFICMSLFFVKYKCLCKEAIVSTFDNNFSNSILLASFCFFLKLSEINMEINCKLLFTR